MDDLPPGPLSAPSRERDHADETTRARRTPAKAAPAPDSHSGRRSTLWLLLVMLVVAGLAAWVVLRSGQQAGSGRGGQAAGAMPVGTAKVATGDMPIALS